MHTTRPLRDIPKPEFDSELNTVIVELEKLREKRLVGSVPPYVFFQMKSIFQVLESLGSNRIEGNRTTISEYAEKIISGVEPEKDEQMREILNIERAIDFLEKHVQPGTPITRAILSEAHRTITHDLTPPPKGEGSRSPGAYRTELVTIKNSHAVLSEHVAIPEHMDELFAFINDSYATQYHLLVMAIAHHRLTVIHPFDNGNGRLVRMLTYAQLLQQGFSVKAGRILNPAAIFCDNRDTYYDMLAKADTGTDAGVLAWCQYVLQGLAREIKKIDNLLDRNYLCNEILLPVLDRALRNKYVTPEEFAVLRFVVAQSKDMVLRAGDLKSLLGEAVSLRRTRFINRLLEKKLVRPIEKGGRIYTVSFFGNFLFREVNQLLVEKGFVPKFLNENTDSL